MRVLAVPSGRSRKSAICWWVRSSRKARLNACRWGGGSAATAARTIARRCVAPGRLGRAGAGLGHAPDAEALGVGFDLEPPAAPPQLVEHAEVGDPQDPGAEGASRRVEGAGLAPDRDEDVLDDLLGGGAAERLGGQVEDQRRVTAVEQAERVLTPGGEVAHQLLVAEIRVRVRCSAARIVFIPWRRLSLPPRGKHYDRGYRPSGSSDTTAPPGAGMTPDRR